MTSNPMYIENDRLVIRSLKKEDLKSLEALGCDHRVYCYGPTFLTELQGTPEEALETLQNMDLYEDRQCILTIQFCLFQIQICICPGFHRIRKHYYFDTTVYTSMCLLLQHPGHA